MGRTLALLLLAANAHAAAALDPPLRVPGPLSERVVAYRIDAVLDADKKQIKGTLHLSWKNRGTAPANELVFHLYLNAFKNTSTHFARESGGGELRGIAADKRNWGYTHVESLRLGGRELVRSLRVDDTLGRLTLPQPVAPGESAELDIVWTAQLPHVFARSGWAEGEFFAIAQWFPKIGVWDCAADGACAWRAHQYHANSEFFSDFGTYEVSLRAPSRFVVAGSGVPAGVEAVGDDKVHRFVAVDVHDFVFAASPRFVESRWTYSDTLGDVEIVYYSFAERAAHFPRHLRAASAGLAEYGARLFPYPYRRLSVVDVPHDGAGAGGMEYPTLFFTFNLPLPEAIHFPEEVTLHELGHQYFCQMLASDEVEEAWLDEGLTDAATDWALGRLLGGKPLVYDLLGRHLRAVDLRRPSYARYARADAVHTRSYEFQSNASYGSITYGKTHLIMETLRGYLGDDRFFAGMRRYAEGMRFRHPRRADFERAFDAGAAENLDWYWRQTLDGTATLDYALAAIEVDEPEPPRGFYDNDAGLATLAPDPSKVAAADKTYHSAVTVERRGDVRFPVEARIVFDDGHEVREHWDGGRSDGAAWHRFSYDGKSAVAWAEVDPERRVVLDVDAWNDGRRVHPDPKPRRVMVHRFERWLSALLALVMR